MSAAIADTVRWLDEHPWSLRLLLVVLVVGAAVWIAGLPRARTVARVAAGGAAAVACVAAAAFLIWTQHSSYGAWWRWRLVETPAQRYGSDSFGRACSSGEAAVVAWLRDLSAAEDPLQPSIAQMGDLAQYTAFMGQPICPAGVSTAVRRAMLDRMEVESRNALQRSRVRGSPGQWFTCQAVARASRGVDLDSTMDVLLTPSRVWRTDRTRMGWPWSPFEYGLVIRSAEWRAAGSTWSPWPTPPVEQPACTGGSQGCALLQDSPAGGELELRVAAEVIITMQGLLEWRAVPMEWQGRVRVNQPVPTQ